MEIRFQQGEPSKIWKLDMFPWHDPDEPNNSAKGFITRAIDTIKCDGDPDITYETEKDDAARPVRRFAILTFPEPCMGKAVAQLREVDDGE